MAMEEPSVILGFPRTEELQHFYPKPIRRDPVTLATSTAADIYDSIRGGITAKTSMSRATPPALRFVFWELGELIRGRQGQCAIPFSGASASASSVRSPEQAKAAVGLVAGGGNSTARERKNWVGFAHRQ